MNGKHKITRKYFELESKKGHRNQGKKLQFEAIEVRFKVRKGSQEERTKERERDPRHEMEGRK